LNEHSLEHCLGGQRAIAIYIVGGWVCHSFNMDPIQSDPSRALLAGAPPYQRLRKLTFATATAVGLEGVSPILL
jgi:hypothetical protein